MNNRNLLLINPWIYDFAAYDFWMKPLGLLQIASILRENGYQIFYVDCLDRCHPELLKLRNADFPKAKDDGRGKFYRERVEKPEILKDVPRSYCRYGITPDIFEGELSKIPPPVAILVTSGMTYWYPGPQATIEMLKNFYPGVPIILGGIYATLLAKHAAEKSGADYVISGEGEDSVLKKVNELIGGEHSGQISPANIDSYPYPAFDLLREVDSVPIMTSRGCPYRCTYCASEKISKKFRQRDPLKVVDEIVYYINKLNTKNFAFYDDALLVNKEKGIKKILREIIRRRIDVYFHTPNGLHAKEIDEELASLMFHSGFRMIRLGLETSSALRQKETGGKITNEEFCRAIDFLEKAGYKRKEIEVYAMMGLPRQKYFEVEETLKFINRNGCTIRLVCYSPIPGTKDWQSAVQESILPLAHDPLLHNNSIFPLRAKKMGWENFQELKNLALELNRSLSG